MVTQRFLLYLKALEGKLYKLISTNYFFSPKTREKVYSGHNSLLEVHINDKVNAKQNSVQLKENEVK